MDAEKMDVRIIVAAAVALAVALVYLTGDKAMVKDELADKDAAGLRKATFAGGCFWCMEPPFRALEGVVDVMPGYAGGDEADPTYEEVSSGATGHVEAVQVTYDSARIGYDRLLEVFWSQIDPTDDGGQFADRGSQYRTAVFYHDDAQRNAAEASRKALKDCGRYGKPIATAILPYRNFYPAEEHHRNYAEKNPLRYGSYKELSGRAPYIRETRGEASAPACRAKPTLTAEQEMVAYGGGTEPPFQNEYWDEHREGIYVDAVNGEPLFSSRDKFDSGTGWPSFTKPIDPASVVEKADVGLGMVRTEVRSNASGIHLGHVFDDGPGPAGRRYCMNSASLRFIPKDDLAKEGYGEYEKLFSA